MKSAVPVISIDGPSGAGKGALCKELSKSLLWPLLDSGAIYRVLALQAIYKKIDVNNEKNLVILAGNLDINFLFEKDEVAITMQGKDVSQEIRNEIVGNIASKISRFPLIRKILLDLQRTFRVLPGLIADGRDMGTVVFPDSAVKIFLDASLEERTYRRMLQLQNKGFSVNFKCLLSEIKKRDDRDRNRIVASLMPASDALILDCTNLTIEDVALKVLAHAKKILATT